ncbi:interferon phi 1 [Clarias gariepinus]
MDGKHSWTYLYFLLFLIVQERCDACDWMISQFRMKNSFCISELEGMSGEITSMHVPFPHQEYYDIEMAKVEDQVRFLTYATDHIIKLLNAVSLKDDIDWDSKKLDNLLNVLDYRQLKELTKCTATYARRAGHSSSEKKLRRHFRKLKKMLNDSNYSANSLAQIRNVMLQHLRRMDIIAANVSQELTKKTN